MGISSGRISALPSARIISRLSPITLSVRRPRKSIFKRPNDSSVVMGNWVVITASLVCRGT